MPRICSGNSLSKLEILGKVSGFYTKLGKKNLGKIVKDYVNKLRFDTRNLPIHLNPRFYGHSSKNLLENVRLDKIWAGKVFNFQFAVWE